MRSKPHNFSTLLAARAAISRRGVARIGGGRGLRLAAHRHSQTPPLLATITPDGLATAITRVHDVARALQITDAALGRILELLGRLRDTRAGPPAERARRKTGSKRTGNGSAGSDLQAALAAILAGAVFDGRPLLDGRCVLAVPGGADGEVLEIRFPHIDVAATLRDDVSAAIKRIVVERERLARFGQEVVAKLVLRLHVSLENVTSARTAVGDPELAAAASQVSPADALAQRCTRWPPSAPQNALRVAANDLGDIPKSAR